MRIPRFAYLIPFWLLPLFLCYDVRAERLPLRSYTVADGLASNQINKIVRDSRGFLWFCTAEGLSRFDGYQFINYGTKDGLPHTVVNDLLETHSGEYWIATNAGLVRFNPGSQPAGKIVYANAFAGPPPMFVTLSPEDSDRRAHAVTVLLEAHDGTIWLGTYKGLYRVSKDGAVVKLTTIDIGIPNEFPDQRLISDLIEDQFGTLWVATPNGLYRRWSDGSAARYTKREGLPDDYLHDLFQDHQGQLWAATRFGGFFRFTFAESHRVPAIAESYAAKDGLPSNWAFQIFETSRNHFWLATANGLAEFLRNGNAGNRFRYYTTKNGLTFHDITALNEDIAGNLWLGSYAGAMKMARYGFVTYDETDGLGQANAIFEDRAGHLCVRGWNSPEATNPKNSVRPMFGRLHGPRFRWFLPSSLQGRMGWVGENLTLQTHEREWWIGTGAGAYRFPPADDFMKIGSLQPLNILTSTDGLAASQVYRLMEDSRGNIWIATTASSGNGLAVWQRSTGTLRDFAGAHGLPSLNDELPRAFGEDNAGEIWIGFASGVARYRNGTFDFFDLEQGLPPGGVQYIYLDHEGRLWLASSRSGLIRVDEPAASHPSFVDYTTARGLSSNDVSVITEDLLGNLYIGTGHGVDQLEPSSGRIKYFTTADGLASGAIVAAFCQHDGTVWFGTQKGLSRLAPDQDPRGATSVKVLITGLKVSGSSQSVSALGEPFVALPDLKASQNEVQVDFIGLGFAPGEVLRYEYKLGAGNWSEAMNQREVNFANLRWGSYRFAVRAINSDGLVSKEPAVVTFTILPPVWLRWWFITLAFVSLTAIGFWAYRYRVTRLLEIANMRTRIATDLHDDIGANLTRISILSEVAKQQFRNGNNEAGNPLSAIAEIARESVASMSDIVWAISPEADSLRDLVRKMRQHADEVFTLRDIDLEFKAPGPEQELRLGANVRRDVLLIFKEAVNNAARHSHCSRVAIDLSANAHELCLRIVDDGSGFDPNSESAGRGLASMRKRSEKLHGKLRIESNAGRGTTVDMMLPLTRGR